MMEPAQLAKVPSDQSSDARGQIDALTGLRFVAALAVVLDHYATAFIWWDPAKGVPSAATPTPTGWAHLFQGGGTGVDCFFVLSGFILAYTYVTPAGSLRGSRWSFWVARIARIYPVYLVGLGLDLLLFFARPHHLTGTLAALGTSPLLLQAWLPSLGTWSSWNPPGWSLSAEALFYLLFPFVLVSLAGKSRRVLWASVGLSIGLLAIVPATLIFLVGTWRPSLWWTLNQVLYFNPLIRLPEFTLGIALGLLFVYGRQRLKDEVSPVARLSGWDVALVALILAAAGAQFLPLPAHYPVSVVMAPIFAAVIFVLASTHGIIRSLLSRVVSVWLGEVSYGIYIMHVPIWASLVWIGHGLLHVSPNAPALVPFYLTCVLVAAGLSNRFIERPARRAIRAHWAAWEGQHRVSRRYLINTLSAHLTRMASRVEEGRTQS